MRYTECKACNGKGGGECLVCGGTGIDAAADIRARMAERLAKARPNAEIIDEFAPFEIAANRLYLRTGRKYYEEKIKPALPGKFLFARGRFQEIRTTEPRAFGLIVDIDTLGIRKFNFFQDPVSFEKAEKDMVVYFLVRIESIDCELYSLRIEYTGYRP